MDSGNLKHKRNYLRIIKFVFIAVLVGLVLMIFLAPWSDLFSVHFGTIPYVCVGRGCKVSGDSGSTTGITVAECKGYSGYLEWYYFGLICFPDAETYCRYTHPLTSKEVCV